MTSSLDPLTILSTTPTEASGFMNMNLSLQVQQIFAAHSGRFNLTVKVTDLARAHS